MHQIYVFYQIIRALKYLHDAQLLHRDLKPSNVLLDSQCNVKICDFGLVRSLMIQEKQQTILSEQVATKWYRAPELLLGSRSYKKPIDVWSFGCIVAEMLTARPMFAGDSTLNQLQKIIEFIGEPNKQDIESLDSPIAEQLISQIKIKKKSFLDYFSGIDPDFWPLIKGTLQFNPQKRMTIEELLQLQLFDQFRQEIQKQMNLEKQKQIIKPQINDNIRFDLKLYRKKLYEKVKTQERKDSQKEKNKDKDKEKKSYSVQKRKNKQRVVSYSKSMMSLGGKNLHHNQSKSLSKKRNMSAPDKHNNLRQVIKVKNKKTKEKCNIYEQKESVLQKYQKKTKNAKQLHKVKSNKQYYFKNNLNGITKHYVLNKTSKSSPYSPYILINQTKSKLKQTISTTKPKINTRSNRPRSSSSKKSVQKLSRHAQKFKKQYPKPFKQIGKLPSKMTTQYKSCKQLMTKC